MRYFPIHGLCSNLNANRVLDRFTGKICYLRSNEKDGQIFAVHEAVICQHTNRL